MVNRPIGVSGKKTLGDLLIGVGQRLVRGLGEIPAVHEFIVDENAEQHLTGQCAEREEARGPVLDGAVEQVAGDGADTAGKADP